jgi:hypothetical protein
VELPRALAKRSQMIAGRYLASACSPQYCSWREGRPAVGPADARELLSQIKHLKRRVMERKPSMPEEERPLGLGAVRRKMAERDRRIAELETMFQELCETNGQLLQAAQKHIHELEALLQGNFRNRPLMRAAYNLSRVWKKVAGR